MFNYKLIAVITLIFLNGCGFSPEKAKLKEEPIAPEQHSNGVKQPEEGQTETAIDPDVMYMLLVAEIAGQREQYDIAL